MSPETKIYVNGINAETGKYMVEPMTYDQIMSFITGENFKKVLKWLQKAWSSFKAFHLGEELDWADLTKVGWGLVFHQGETEAVKSALEPLYQHRLSQVGDDTLVKKLEYIPGETWEEFLGRYGIGPGSKEPKKVPFYLLLVGSPDQIPFSFGYMLDLAYAVGRLDFDRVEDYQVYVASLIAYENAAAPPNSRTAVFFGTRHPLDLPTELSADHLVTPLADGLPGQPGIAQQLGWQTQKLVEQHAIRDNLIQVFAPAVGSKPPSFLFTASHGMIWPLGNAEQRYKQGALLCQDWPGFGKMAPEHYFAASNLPEDARVAGLISFHFACYSAGTPQIDRFIHKPRAKPPEIASAPFIAALPKALLSHRNGGALAVIGHVERAWDTSIATPQAGNQIGPFSSAIAYILNGKPVGYAITDINMRYAEYSVRLSNLLQRKSTGEIVPDEELASAWIRCNDAEGYIVVGDPAVRLRSKELV